MIMTSLQSQSCNMHLFYGEWQGAPREGFRELVNSHRFQDVEIADGYQSCLSWQCILLGDTR